MAQERQVPTLYDFIFIDRPRVESIYSQLYSGLLNVIEKLASESNTKTRVLQVGGSPVGVMGHRVAHTTKESMTEKIDPHDLILRDVLSGLVENDLVLFDAESAKPGDFVLLQGNLSLLDFEFFEAAADVFPDFMHNPTNKPPTEATKKNERERKQRKKIATKCASLVKK